MNKKKTVTLLFVLPIFTGMKGKGEECEGKCTNLALLVPCTLLYTLMHQQQHTGNMKMQEVKCTCRLEYWHHISIFRWPRDKTEEHGYVKNICKCRKGIKQTMEMEEVTVDMLTQFDCLPWKSRGWCSGEWVGLVEWYTVYFERSKYGCRLLLSMWWSAPNYHCHVRAFLNQHFPL